MSIYSDQLHKAYNSILSKGHKEVRSLLKDLDDCRFDVDNNAQMKGYAVGGYYTTPSHRICAVSTWAISSSSRNAPRTVFGLTSKWTWIDSILPDYCCAYLEDGPSEITGHHTTLVAIAGETAMIGVCEKIDGLAITGYGKPLYFVNTTQLKSKLLEAIGHDNSYAKEIYERLTKQA